MDRNSRSDKKVDKNLSEERKKVHKTLVELFSSVTNEEEMAALMDDLLTEKEKEDIVDRYLLMEDLYLGQSQREIAARRNMSLCKITRGSKMLKKKNGYIRRILSEKYDDHRHI